LYGLYATGANINSALANMSNIQSYTNNQGCSVRLDPLVNPDIFRFRNWDDYSYGGNTDYNSVPLPTIFVFFRNTIADTAGVTNIPCYLDATWWLEARLTQPTPIYASPSPVDPSWPMICDMLRNGRQQYPIVAKGHSFETFMKSTSRWGAVVKDSMRFGSQIYMQNYKGAYNSGKRIYTNLRPIFQKTKVRGRRTGRKQFTTNLSRPTKPPRKRTNVPKAGFSQAVNKPRRKHKKRYIKDKRGVGYVNLDYGS